MADKKVTALTDLGDALAAAEVASTSVTAVVKLIADDVEPSPVID